MSSQTVYPGYQLNPGDMFQVEPEKVMFATGAPKNARERRATRSLRKRPKETSQSSPSQASSPSAPEDSTQTEPDTPIQDPRTTLKELIGQAKSMLTSSSSSDLSAKRKQDLRAFKRTLQRTLSRPNILSDSIDAQLLELTHKLNLDPSPATETTPSRPKRGPPRARPESILLRKALEEARDNPIDASKPYATPWRPRPFMSAFAFVPRYLEVHHRICSAVYLRHPVARPGLGEVPTPYPTDLNGLAFNWYLRRR